MSRRARSDGATLALAAAYPERAEPQPAWHDRLAETLFDRLWWALARRVRRPAVALARIIPLVNTHAAAMQGVDAAGLAVELARVRGLLRRQGLSAEAVAPTLALLREVAQQSLGKRPYDVQLMGAWALLQGRLAEMATGEGKSLTASLGVATAALSGLPVHVVTVNDYLAGRDRKSVV